MSISTEHSQFFHKHGYLILRDVLSASETESLQRWAQEVHDWPTDERSQWMPYEEINADGKTVLCRTENYVNYHEGFNTLLRGDKLLNMLQHLAGEPMLLFKEKINYKLAGSGGFAPHIDSTAYTHIKNIKHLTILLAVDPANVKNGGLEVVDGSHLMNVPIGQDNCIEPEWAAKQSWTPVNLEAGQLLIFGSYLAHRSGANRSSTDRKAIYATYNCAGEGDLHDEYYAHRKILWPPMQLRKKGEDYKEGALRYGFGSPMLSVDLGKQLEPFYQETSNSTTSPVKSNPIETSSKIVSLLKTYGQSDYIGEPVSQIQHSLQCAYLASRETQDPQTIVAALLHDIGQFIPEHEAEALIGQVHNMEGTADINTNGVEQDKSKTSNSVGRVAHETLGGQYLISLGFPKKVATLVEAHVPAKRYLCAIEPGYYDALSEASKQSLKFQGGPMSKEEVDDWNQGEWADEKASLRRWDDKAKIVGIEVPGIERYQGMIEQVLTATTVV